MGASYINYQGRRNPTHRLRVFPLMAGKTTSNKSVGTARIQPAMLKRNALLAGLTGKHLTAVLDAGEVVTLTTRQQIYKPGGPIEHAYFPLSAMLSVVTRLKDGEMIEIGTVGREGTSAIPLIFGASTSANESYCQVPGVALKIPAPLFKQLHATSEKFRRLLDRYVQAYINLLGQLAACNRLHSVYERCARWLLMTQDRVQGDELPLTHEYLAMMLGTRRSGVTSAAAAFREAGFIRYARNCITILDREGLEAASCECYAVAKKQFSGLLRALH